MLRATMSHISLPFQASDSGSLDVVLCKAPYPWDVDNLLKIAEHPSFCHICCNLFAGSAYRIFPRPDISIGETTRPQDTKYTTLDDGHVPQWPGGDKIEHLPCQFTASSADLISGAERSCSSCSILLNGIMKLNDTSPPEVRFKKNLDFEATVIFCKGDVLRVIVDLDENTTTGSMLGIMGAPEKTTRPIMNCEFYTLPCTYILIILYFLRWLKRSKIKILESLLCIYVRINI